MNRGIAIVGMSCVYPDARSPLELWENVLAQRRAFRRMPSERLRMEFRAEAFNVSNTPPLNDPNGSFGSAAFGCISTWRGCWMQPIRGGWRTTPPSSLSTLCSRRSLRTWPGPSLMDSGLQGKR